MNLVHFFKKLGSMIGSRDDSNMRTLSKIEIYNYYPILNKQ